MVSSYIFDDIGGENIHNNGISNTTLMYFAIAMSFYAIIAICKSFDLFAIIKNPTNPVIAYKKAVLTINSMDIRNKKIDISFKGVGVNRRYGIDDTSANRAKGFHMYRDIKDAFDHDQSGDTILEVMGYGKIQYYEKGYITTRQKVLQIIIDENNYLQNINLFKNLITNEWTDKNNNSIIFVPKVPYTYKERLKIITVPTINKTVLPKNNSNYFIK